MLIPFPILIVAIRVYPWLILLAVLFGLPFLLHLGQGSFHFRNGPSQINQYPFHLLGKTIHVIPYITDLLILQLAVIQQLVHSVMIEQHIE
jgi:hypothetical protein